MNRKLFLAILAIIALLTFSQSCFYSPKYMFRVIAWQDADYDDYKKFKSVDIQSSETPFHFVHGSDQQQVDFRLKFESENQIENLNNFLATHKTHSFIVIRNDTLLYEKYFEENKRSTLQSSFSVSKSVLSLLMGIAIDNGLYG